MSDIIREIEEYAHDNNVPIMLSDGIDFMCDYIRDYNVKNILEIGTAIGYSAIRMASVSKSIHIDTIERDKDRYLKACSNIKRMGMESQINAIYGDAMDVSVDKMGMYDLIFIDASKGHSTDFFLKFSPLLAENGVIITDNLSFHGLVEDESLAVTKNQKGLVKRIKKFICFLDNNSEYVTEYISVGDKISISRRK